jgi:protein-S-isoprenylcysteine O-methyltransferase Ste14
MDPLYRQAVVQGVFGLVFFIALVFVPAGTWDYWQGWAFLAVFVASTTAFTIYLATNDKPLLERRLKAGPWHEQERSQKIIVSLVFVAFFAFIILPVLDHRRDSHGCLHGSPSSATRSSSSRTSPSSGSSGRTVGPHRIFGWRQIRESSIAVPMRTCAIRCMPQPSGCWSGSRLPSAPGGRSRS